MFLAAIAVPEVVPTNCKPRDTDVTMFSLGSVRRTLLWTDTHDWACLAEAPAFEIPCSWSHRKNMTMIAHPDVVPDTSMCCACPVEPRKRTSLPHGLHRQVRLGHPSALPPLECQISGGNRDF